MKNLRRLAGISIFLTVIFMIITLFQFQKEEAKMPLLPNQFELSFNESWQMTFISELPLSKDELKSKDGTQRLIREAMSEKEYQKISLPYSMENTKESILVFENILPKEYAGQMLKFSSTNAIVLVVLDGEIIYEYGLEAAEPDKLSGDNENLVVIPSVFQTGEILIELITPYSDTASLGGIQIETRDMVVIGMIGNDIADIGCCVLIVIMAIIMFVLVLIRRYTRQPARGELFLGLAGLVSGIYCFIDTDTLSIFYNMYKAYEMQDYLMLMLPLFLALYFEQNLHTVYPRRFSALLCFVSIHAVIQILLQILGVCNMGDMVNISAAVLGIVCALAIVSLIQLDYQNKRYQTLLSVLSLLVLLLGGMTNTVVNTILKRGYANKTGQYSMMVFGIMMAVLHILQLSKEYRANTEENARLLKERIKTAEQQNILLAQARQEAENAKQEALAANEAKGKFLAHMSHEIRTPINAVLGMDEMILRESGEKIIKEYAMDIYMAGQTLLSLINDILDFSKIDSGKMEIVPVEYDIGSLIYDLVNMVSHKAKDKNIKLEVEIDHKIPCRFYGDDVRIRQILTNILTNAVKYTQEGTVWLRVKGQKTEDTATLRFEVEDTGIGIKEEDLSKLSAEFERIEEDRNRNIEGSGLGMNITIQLLTLLGSSLQVESIYGKGSKFWFELKQKIIDNTPLGDFETRVHRAAKNYDYKTKFFAPNARILVVDDNAVNRKVLRNLLKETKVQITDVESGMECLKIVEKNHYDLIFLDHMMPEMDGVETLHRIKGLSGSPCRNTPVVVLTANAVSGAKEKYLSEGFDDFLSKPVVPEKLENIIRKMLPEELVLKASDGESRKNLTQQKKTDDFGDILEQLPMVDGLDWYYAWIHLPDTALLEYTMKEFYEQIDSAADNLEQLYKRITEPEALNQYRIQVHAMKSLAATVGIIPLAGLAKILEYAAKQSRLDVIVSITPTFLEEWHSYHEKLQGVFGIGSADKKEVTDFSVIRALVEMVRLSMQEMDIERADKFMEQLQEYQYSKEIDIIMKKLAEAVTNFDSEKTERFAEMLIEQMKG